MKTRAVIALLVVFVAILAGAAVVFAFGTPKAPPPDPSSRFAIEIPGCVCHSDDPQVVEEHSRYRMNQCFGCHADGVPEMAR